ncbi:MAG: hypothetical protein HN754_09895 [Opitutae bacterium]|nr:hypothetical protein [Opitutae bacterium]
MAQDHTDALALRVMCKKLHNVRDCRFPKINPRYLDCLQHGDDLVLRGIGLNDGQFRIPDQDLRSIFELERTTDMTYGSIFQAERFGDCRACQHNHTHY